MVPTLEELRLQCRIDHEDPDDDNLLTTYAKAARKKIENFTNRKLYDTEVPGDDAIGLLVDDDIKLAVMLLVGFWYENRETVNIGNISTVLPYTFEALVEPYRFIPL